jgi:polyisoprenoid-binding protein YceI
MYRTIALVLVGLGMAAAAQAAPKSYDFDMAHSRIFFDVNHLGYSTMVGRFSEFGGTFQFDAEDPTNSHLDITIDPASVDMFHEGLNNHLRNPDFFDVEQYPELRFTSERVEASGENQYVVHGQFTMLGETRPLSFNVIMNRTGQARSGAPMVGFSAYGTLDRTDYGMGFGAPNVGTEIDFRLEIEASEAADESS